MGSVDMARIGRSFEEHVQLNAVPKDPREYPVQKVVVWNPELRLQFVYTAKDKVDSDVSEFDGDVLVGLMDRQGVYHGIPIPGASSVIVPGIEIVGEENYEEPGRHRIRTAKYVVFIRAPEACPVRLLAERTSWYHSDRSHLASRTRHAILVRSPRGAGAKRAVLVVTSSIRTAWARIFRP